jgi:hypothetical protein
MNDCVQENAKRCFSKKWGAELPTLLRRYAALCGAAATPRAPRGGSGKSFPALLGDAETIILNANEYKWVARKLVSGSVRTRGVGEKPATGHTNKQVVRATLGRGIRAAGRAASPSPEHGCRRPEETAPLPPLFKGGTKGIPTA